MPKGKLIKIGIWENKKFVGCIIFGKGATPFIGNPYNLTHIQVCELVRIALKNHNNYISKYLSIAIKMLKTTNSGLKLIVSYADTHQNHTGIIYQASNWIYVGTTKNDKCIMINNKIMHTRSAHHKYGSYAINFLQKTIDNKAQYVYLPKKHKYLYPLTKNICKQIELLSKPYPKHAAIVQGSTPRIQQGSGVQNDLAAQIN